MSKRLTLRVLLEEAVTRYGTQALAAKAIGIERSRISKFLTERKDGDSLEAVNCLRLALALGRRAEDVLAAAGKSDVLPVLEQLFGAGIKPPKPTYPNVLMEVSPDERSVIEALRMVKEKQS